MIGANIACGKRMIVIRCGSVVIVFVGMPVLGLGDGLPMGGVILACGNEDCGKPLQRQHHHHHHEHEFFHCSKHGGAF